MIDFSSPVAIFYYVPTLSSGFGAYFSHDLDG